MALLNYAPISLIAPSSIRVEQIDPAVHLQHLTYYLGLSSDEPWHGYGRVTNSHRAASLYGSC